MKINGFSYGNNRKILIIQNAAGSGRSTANRCFSLDDENGTDPTVYFESTFDTLIDIINLATFGIEHNGAFFIQLFSENSLVATRVKGVDWIDNVGDVIIILGKPNYTVQT